MKIDRSVKQAYWKKKKRINISYIKRNEWGVFGEGGLRAKKEKGGIGS